MQSTCISNIRVVKYESRKMLASEPSTSSLTTSNILSQSRLLLDGGPVHPVYNNNNTDDSDDDQSVELDDSQWQIATSDESTENDEKVGECVGFKPEPDIGANGSGIVSNVKDYLRTKIQRRRVSEGAEEIKVTFEPPKSYKLTEEEKRKYERRKQRNRDSANRSRLKRKFQLDYLEKENEQLTKKNQDLIAEVNGLKRTKELAKKLLSSHDCVLARDSSSSGNTSSSHTHPVERQPETRVNSEDYNRGRAAFLKLSPEKQLEFLEAYKRRIGIQPSTSANS